MIDPNPAPSAVGPSKRLQRSAADCIAALKHPRLWVFLGWRDFTTTYDRARLGMIWAFAQPVVWILAVYLFLGPAFSDGARNYLLYASLGVVLYFFLSTVIAGGSGLFLKHKGIITNVPMPLFVLPLRHACSTSAQLLLHLCIPIAVIIATDVPLSWTMLLAIPALFVIAFAAAFVSAGMGVIGAWFGDFQFIVTAVMRVLMFVTPIFWYPEDRSGAIRAIAVTYNPLAHLIDLVRSPMMGQLPSQQTLVGASITIGASLLIGWLLFAFGRRQIIRWI